MSDDVECSEKKGRMWVCRAWDRIHISGTETVFLTRWYFNIDLSQEGEE